MFVVERRSRHECGRNKRRAGLAREGSPRGQALEALRASHLLDRFYAWRGFSGERYICSVFPLEDESIAGGFSQAVAIGVARDARGRRPICLLSSREFATPAGRSIRADARALGVTEWHVHFGSGDAGLRDLADALLN